MEFEKDVFEYREFAVQAGKGRFPVLVLDSPEKWKLASEIKATHRLDITETQAMEFALSGISLAQWEEVEEKHVIPEKRENMTQEAEKEIKNAEEAAVMAKKVAFFEISTGKTIPGETDEDKNHFLAERCVGHLESLYEYITTSLVNLVDGRLVREYIQATMEDRTSVSVTRFTGFDSWAKASDTRVSFVMCRPFQDFIIEIPLKGISEERRRQIEEETPSPKPPMLPARRSDGKGFDHNALEPNFNDPTWRIASRAAQQKKTALLFSECLTFEIPGDTNKDKYDWIASHLVGDVVRIKNYIESNILSYEGRVNFFGTSSYL